MESYDVFEIIFCSVVIVTVMLLLAREKYRQGYEQGQIDAINGKVKYILIELEDKSRLYVKEEDLKHYKNYTVISGEEN